MLYPSPNGGCNDPYSMWAPSSSPRRGCGAAAPRGSRQCRRCPQLEHITPLQRRGKAAATVGWAGFCGSRALSLQDRRWAIPSYQRRSSSLIKRDGNVRFPMNLYGVRRSARTTSRWAPKAHRMMGKTQWRHRSLRMGFSLGAIMSRCGRGCIHTYMYIYIYIYTVLYIYINI